MYKRLKLISFISILLIFIIFINNGATYAYAIENPIAPYVEKYMLSGIFNGKFTDSNGTIREYRLRIPENPTTNMPLIIWLHGIGEKGNPDLLNNLGVIEACNLWQEERFYVLQPSLKRNEAWYEEDVQDSTIELIDHIVKTLHIDQNRLILTGHSLGGQGTWLMGNRFIDKWAALAPVSSPAYLKITDLINSDIPIWAFSGEYDHDEVIEGMSNHIIAMNKCDHTNIAYTIIERAEHGDMNYLPYNNEFFNWAIHRIKNTP